MCVDARVDPIGTVCPTRLALSTTERFSFFRDRALLAAEHQVLSLNRVDCAPHITSLFGSTRLELSLLACSSRTALLELLPAFIIGTGESARPGAARRSNQLLTRNSSCFLPCFAPKLYIILNHLSFVDTKPALNAMQVAASAVLAMESPNWSTACGVALVAAGVFVIV